jgi:hypothetical protein
MGRWVAFVNWPAIAIMNPIYAIYFVRPHKFANAHLAHSSYLWPTHKMIIKHDGWHGVLHYLRPGQLCRF